MTGSMYLLLDGVVAADGPYVEPPSTDGAMTLTIALAI